MKQWLLAILSLVFINSYAQTADEVIEKYSAAMGGLDAFNKVATAKMTGSMTTGGVTLAMTTQIVHGKSMRTDVTANGKAIINVYSNGAGWKINPLAGAPTKTPVTGTELEGLKAQVNLVNNLMDYKSRGHAVEFLGEEMMDGATTYKLKLTTKDDGKTTMYFINTVNYMLAKSVSQKQTDGIPYEVETFYTGMKNIDGLQFCMYLIQKVKGRLYMSIKWDKIELNVPVDERIFEK